jgi:glycosyltransferase involved in cell wall biosynthesis
VRIASVVAAYDERENIEALARRLDRTLRSLQDFEYELIFMVEGTDGTRQILEALRADLPAIRVFYQETPCGLGNALRRGFDAVGGAADFIVTLDADLNHQPEEIPRLFQAVQTRHADILVGSRFIPGSRVDGTPLWKLFLSGTLNLIIRMAFGLKVKDKTSGFRIYRTASLRSLDWVNENFAALPEILIRAARARLRIEEAPIHFIYRREGRSKMYFWPTVFSYFRLLRMSLKHPPPGRSAGTSRASGRRSG